MQMLSEMLMIYIFLGFKHSKFFLSGVRKEHQEKEVLLDNYRFHCLLLTFVHYNLYTLKKTEMRKRHGLKNTDCFDTLFLAINVKIWIFLVEL